MATNKAIRSHSLAQPKPQHSKTARAGGPEPKRRRPNPHLKAELLDDLRQLNRGYGIALAALTRLHKPDLFPRDCLRNFVHRTEALQALVNRDLLRLFAGLEDHDADRFTRLTSQPAEPSQHSRPNRRPNS